MWKKGEIAPKEQFLLFSTLFYIKKGEIAPKEQFLLFSTLFYIYIYIYLSNFRSQITYSFVKCGCSIYCLPHSLNSDMSRYGYLEVLQ